MHASRTPGDPDRALALEEFLEVGLQALADEAVEEGWSDAEIDAALLGLVRARLMVRIANGERDEPIAKRQRAHQTAPTPSANIFGTGRVRAA